MNRPGRELPSTGGEEHRNPVRKARKAGGEGGRRIHRVVKREVKDPPSAATEIVTGVNAGKLKRAADKLGGPFKVEVQGWPGETVTLDDGSQTSLTNYEMYIAITGEGPSGDTSRLRSEAKKIKHRRSRRSRSSGGP